MELKFADKVAYMPEKVSATKLNQFIGQIGIVVAIDALDDAWAYVSFYGMGQFKVVPVPVHSLSKFVGEYWYYAHIVGNKQPVAMYNTRQECMEAAIRMSKTKNNFPYLIVHQFETTETESVYEECIIMGDTVFEAKING